MLHVDLTVDGEARVDDRAGLWIAWLEAEALAVVHDSLQSVEVLAVLREPIQVSVDDVVGLVHLVGVGGLLRADEPVEAERHGEERYADRGDSQPLFGQAYRDGAWQDRFELCHQPDAGS